MTKWQLQDAKANLSELMTLAETEGPQEITVRGEPKVVVVSVEEFQGLRNHRPTLLDALLRAPLDGVALELERHPPEDMREIEL